MGRTRLRSGGGKRGVRRRPGASIVEQGRRPQQAVGRFGAGSRQSPGCAAARGCSGTPRSGGRQRNRERHPQAALSANKARIRQNSPRPPAAVAARVLVVSVGALGLGRRFRHRCRAGVAEGRCSSGACRSRSLLFPSTHRSSLACRRRGGRCTRNRNRTDDTALVGCTRLGIPPTRKLRGDGYSVVSCSGLLLLVSAAGAGDGSRSLRADPLMRRKARRGRR